MANYKTIKGRLVVKEINESVVGGFVINDSDKSYKTVTVLEDCELSDGEKLTSDQTIFIKPSAGTKIRDFIVISEGDILTYEEK